MSSARWLRLTLLVVTSMFLAACLHKPKRVEMQSLDPDSVADAAIQQYDSDGDGMLSKVELAKCPGMLKAIDLYDQNGDGKVSEDEIAARINKWIELKTAMLTVSCSVKLDGKMLDGGKIEFIPEEFFGDAIHPASGDIQKGYAMLAIDPSLLPPEQANLQGLHPGVYKVKVTHPSIKIPAKFNTETTLGQEIAMDNEDIESMEFTLRSK